MDTDTAPVVALFTWTAELTVAPSALTEREMLPILCATAETTTLPFEKMDTDALDPTLLYTLVSDSQSVPAAVDPPMRPLGDSAKYPNPPPIIVTDIDPVAATLIPFTLLTAPELADSARVTEPACRAALLTTTDLPLPNVEHTFPDRDVSDPHPAVIAADPPTRGIDEYTKPRAKTVTDTDPVVTTFTTTMLDAVGSSVDNSRVHVAGDDR
jgi:hypothetical protein